MLVIKENDHFVLGSLFKEHGIDTALSEKTTTSASNSSYRVLTNGVVIAGVSNCCIDYLEYFKPLKEAKELTYDFIENTVAPYLKERLEEIEFMDDGDKCSSQAIILKDKCFIILEDWFIWEVKTNHDFSRNTSERKFVRGALEITEGIPARERCIKILKDYNTFYGSASKIMIMDTSVRELEVVR